MVEGGVAPDAGPHAANAAKRAVAASRTALDRVIAMVTSRGRPRPRTLTDEKRRSEGPRVPWARDRRDAALLPNLTAAPGSPRWLRPRQKGPRAARPPFANGTSR